MIDAWIQHPTARHSGDPMFDSLRRWTKSDLDRCRLWATPSPLWMQRVFRWR